MGLLAVQPRLVPVADLYAEEHASDDDGKIDRDREPIVLFDMLPDSSKDHLPPLGRNPSYRRFCQLLTLLSDHPPVNGE